jgi:hypothetical protein
MPSNPEPTELPEWHATSEGLASHRNALDQIAKLADWLVANTGEPRQSYGAVDAAINEMTRLRAELDSMTKFAEDLREERDRRLRSEGERGVERDALAAKIESAAELHPAWFCETCNSPGPCLTRLRLGLDQSEEDQR